VKRAIVVLISVLAILAVPITASAYPPAAPTLGTSASSPVAGGTFTLTANGFCPGASVTFTIGTTTVGTATANASGTATITATAPAAPGTYTATATSAGNCPATATVTITVVAAAGPTTTVALPPTGSSSTGPLLWAASILVLVGLAIAVVAARRRSHALA
jgi:hypothetical protein